MQASPPNRLRELRLKHRGLTCKRIGEELGWSEAAVSRWELGQFAPPDTAKRLLARKYGVTVDYLMGWDTVPAVMDGANGDGDGTA